MASGQTALHCALDPWASKQGIRLTGRIMYGQKFILVSEPRIYFHDRLSYMQHKVCHALEWIKLYIYYIHILQSRSNYLQYNQFRILDMICIYFFFFFVLRTIVLNPIRSSARYWQNYLGYWNRSFLCVSEDL